MIIQPCTVKNPVPFKYEYPTNLQETISVSKGSWKVCAIDDYSPSKYNPGVSFNHFPNGPWTLKIKEQTINLNPLFCVLLSVLSVHQDKQVKYK